MQRFALKLSIEPILRLHSRTTENALSYDSQINAKVCVCGDEYMGAKKESKKRLILPEIEFRQRKENERANQRKKKRMKEAKRKKN